MNKRLWTLLLTSVAVAGIVLAGCGGKEEEKTPTKPEVKAPKIEAPPVEPPPVEPPPVEPPPVEPPPVEPPPVEPPPVEPPPVEPPPVEPPPVEPPATGKVKTPYWGAKVGDMVKAKMMGGMIKIDKVVKVDDEFAHVETSMIMGETKMPAQPANKMPRYAQTGEATTPKAKVDSKKIGDETLKIGDKDVKCEVWQTVMEMAGKKITSKMWKTDEILGGVAKMESDAMGSMKVTLEVIEFKKG